MKSKISNKGYIIYKDDFTEKELKNTKKTLNVSPYSPYQSKFTPPPSFPVYQEGKRKLYLPRYWALSNLGKTDNIQIKDGFDINLDFKGDLRPIQKEAIDAYIKNCYPEFGGGILCLGCGSGKSNARDTPVIMYDGTIKMIQDVKIGDQLMGDDSTPRNVLNLGRGMEMMYDIVPTKGDTYTVNESHILSLKYSTNRNKNVRKGDVIDISLKDYMNLPPSYHGRGGILLGYRVGVDFPYKEVDIDPYFLGYWIGDGTCLNTQITTIEECVVDYCYKYAEELNQQVTQGKDTYDDNGNLKNRHSIKYTICGKLLENGKRTPNQLLHMLQKHNLIGNKHIPHIYKCNSREIRLKLLAGIIDSDGSNDKNSYDIIQKNEKLLDDIIYLARSLGFACYKKECKKYCMYKGEKKEGTYYRTCIHGKGLEEIPVKCERKKVQPRRQIKDALTTRIKVVPKGVDYYYGVELDGNHRYLLGSFTVTHNTVIALNLVSQLKKKALIVVHKEFLLNQWIERIKMFLPTAQVGRIQGKTFDIAGKDIVIGMLQSLSMKTYDEDAFDSFGTTIIDECFPASTYIHTSEGLKTIYTLYDLWKQNKNLPTILSFNKDTNIFEYKKLTYGWRKFNRDLLQINMSKKTIKCTHNHKILTSKGYIKACDLNINDIILSKYDNNHIDNIIAPALNEDQLQIVYGSYLGDGHISITNKNRYRLKIIHCEKQEEYCNWKASMFSIRKLNYIQKNGYSQKPAYSFISKIFDLDNQIPQNTKNIPEWILNNLNEKGIAIWMMDDGSICKKTNSIRIHSNNYDLETHNKLQNKFKQYNIDCSIHTTRKYYYLIFNVENSNKLINLIKPYIHTSMLYKINNLIRDNIYTWNNNFMNYGTLKVSGIKEIKQKQKNPYVYDIEVEDNHNFIIGTKISTKHQQYIDGPIVSNCHHISSEVFSRALPKISTKYTLGLTATPNRADGLQKVFEWFLGPIVYQGKRKHTHDVFVKIIEIQDTTESYCKIEEGYDGKPVTARMINNVANYKPRTDIIIEEVKSIMLEPGRKILILSDRRDHLKLMKELLTELEFDVGFYLGGMKQKDLDISETKPIILGTFSMSSEALDIPELNTLFMTTPKSNIEQSVGRILRKQHEIRPLIIDIKDNFKPFSNQFTKRKTFYKKCKYQMKEITIKSSNYVETITENKDLHNLMLDSNLDITIECKEKKQSNLTEFLMISDDD